MKNLLTLFLAFFAFTSTSNAQCDANWTYTNISCDSVYFFPVSTGAQYTYSWNFGDGNSSTDPSPTHAYASDGSYTAYLTITDTVAQCSQSITQIININCGGACTLNPVVTHTVNSSNCEVLFASNVTGGTPPYTYFWNFGDGNTSTLANPTHQYPNNSTWLACLSVTDANGCVADSVCMPITVNCTPTSCDPNFTHNLIGCDSVQFFPVSIGTQYSYSWDFGDGNTSTETNPIHQFSDGTWVVTLVITDTVANCNATSVLTIVIDCAYSPCNTTGAIAWNVDTTNCNVQFVSTAYGGTAPYTFFWQFGDGTTSNSPNPVHQYPNNSIWTPCLTITDANGCDTVICDVVQVNCSPTSCDAQFTYTNINCNEVLFSPVSIGPQYTYFWDFGDGNTSTDASPTHIFADGIHVITLTITDTLTGCSDTWWYTIQTYCPCNVDAVFTFNQNSQNCNVHFASSAWGGQAPYTYFWNFGDGNTSTQANPIHQYPNNTTWTPCLTVTDANGCDTTICQVVTVSCTSVNCNATHTYTNISCDSIWFIPAVQDSSFQYLWDFGDGNTSTEIDPIHQYATNGSYLVVLYISDSISGCSHAYTSQVWVNCGATPCDVQSVITWQPDSADCSVWMINSTWGGTPPYTYYWSFGDGATSNDPNPSHTYATPGPWTPCLTVTDANGCDTTLCMVVTPNCTVGMDELMELPLEVYPNPSSGIFNVLLADNSNVQIFDLSGKLVYSSTVQKSSGLIQIDLTHLRDGIYILQVANEQGTATKKLLKK